MTDPFEVLSSERGVVRVFTTDVDAEGSSAITPENVHRLLGDDLDLDPSRIEVFPSTVLEAMGLSTYLMEGYGVPDSELKGQAASLDALKGLVVLVASAAFKGQVAILDPKPGLRFVGAFQEPGMAPPEPMAAPESIDGPLSPPDRDTSLNARRGSRWPIALMALLIAAGLVLFLVF
ncbi:MAG: hypothetical protein AAF230_04170 [Pseudomonadota bacterium]